MTRLRLTCLMLGLVLGAGPSYADSNPSGYSAAGLYNLANSYARAGKPGMAILNYERASLLAPNDADVYANLRFVRQSLHLPVETRSAFDRFAAAVRPLWLFWMGIAGVIVIGASLVAAKLSARHRRLRLVALLLGALMIGWPSCSALVLWPKLHDGVIVIASTPVRVSPVPMGDSLFALPEGETVRITAQHEGFTLIRTRAGRAGWVANPNLAPIVPRTEERLED